MFKAIKAYFFIPSGMRNYIEHGFEGWGLFYFIYVGFCALLIYEASASVKVGIYRGLQSLAFLFLFVILSTICAFILGAKEPAIKAMRLVGLCLPTIVLTILFMARKSPLTFLGIYPIMLFVYGSAFLGLNRKILGVLAGMITITLVIGLTYLFSDSSDKWFGQELTIDGYKAELTKAPIFNRDESKIYRYLLYSSPKLGHIPQADELADSLRLDPVKIQNALLKLDEKGCIVLGADREIRYAYPWAMYDQGYEILIEKEDGSESTRPVFAASAFHALSAATLFGNKKIRILGRINDTGEMLVIEIDKGQIGSTNHPEAQIYKSDIFSEMEFYSSPAGAKSSYRGRYDSTRLLSLDRAVVVAGDYMKGIARGILSAP
ncbi:MAG TPA: hypothetical protein DEO84_04065 [candidate division Zixibacteria bacterium]|nr:hypothetical protein [candidate division Zixibacteria bacterium]HBZ00479.1 hypothetical protein [candidate division Zixibacteria bacterium]